MQLSFQYIRCDCSVWFVVIVNAWLCVTYELSVNMGTYLQENGMYVGFNATAALGLVGFLEHHPQIRESLTLTPGGRSTSLLSPEHIHEPGYYFPTVTHLTTPGKVHCLTNSNDRQFHSLPRPGSQWRRTGQPPGCLFQVGDRYWSQLTNLARESAIPTATRKEALGSKEQAEDWDTWWVGSLKYVSSVAFGDFWPSWECWFCEGTVSVVKFPHLSC